MINVALMRQKIKSAISKAPIKVDFIRVPVTQDEVGGQVEGEPIYVAKQVEGLLDNGHHNALNVITTDGGTSKTNKYPLFYTVFEEGAIFKAGDYFLFKGKKFVVSNAVNILELDIYWEMNIEEVV